MNNINIVTQNNRSQYKQNENKFNVYHINKR